MTNLDRLQVKVSRLVFPLIISSLLFGGCTTVKQSLFNDGAVNAKTLRAYLDMPQSTELSQKSVEAAAVSAFSPRMAEYQIYHYMQIHHISSSPKDSMAYYIPKDSNKEIVCLLSYNPEPHSVVTYRIVCDISDDKMVKGVIVTESMKSI